MPRTVKDVKDRSLDEGIDSLNEETKNLDKKQGTQIKDNPRVGESIDEPSG